MTRVMFDNTDLSEFGYSFQKVVDEVPEHDYEEVTVVGKDGTLLLDNKRMKNVEESYDIVIPDNTENSLDALRNFLASKVGYKRLEDDIRPNHYTKARFVGLDSTVTSERTQAVATMEFERIPQRYLKSGEEMVELGASLTNPTRFDSKPIFRLWGNGTLMVNSYVITVANSPYEYVDIDCEIMDCFYGLNNANQYVTFSTTGYITLQAGLNSFDIDGFTKVEVTPRWYEI